MNPILDKRYGSTKLVNLAEAARAVQVEFFTENGDYRTPSSIDPATGRVQNTKTGLKIPNGDFVAMAAGMKASLYAPDLSDSYQLVQNAITTFGVLGNMQVKQAETEVVSILGHEMFEPQTDMNVAGGDSDTTVRAPVKTMGKILPLNAKRVLIKNQSYSVDYFTWCESSVALPANTGLYVSAFLLGIFFPVSLSKYPNWMERLGITRGMLEESE